MLLGAQQLLRWRKYCAGGAMNGDAAPRAEAGRPLSPAPRVRVARRLFRQLRWLKILPFVIVFAVALVARQRLLAPMQVRRHVVDGGEVVREAFGRATVESRREVELGFDLVGRISDVLVDEGDRVKLGQVVAHLAPEQFTSDVHAATSGVSLAKAAKSRLFAEQRRAEATLAFAEQESTRMRALAAAGAVNARDLDLAEQQLALAKADLDRGRAALGEAERQIDVASGTTESKAVTVTRAALVSPFDGMVIRRLKDPGNTVTVGTSVLRIVSVDRLWARTAVDESMLAELREGMPAQIALLGDVHAPLRGSVDRIGREVDRQTHEVLVDVLLAEVPARIAIGRRADVNIELERRESAARIPVAFLHHDANGFFAFVDDGGRIARATLQIGAIGRDFVEVTGGLSPGTIVLDALHAGGTLSLGRRYRVEP
jgi:HlyD family secretion protein